MTGVSSHPLAYPILQAWVVILALPYYDMCAPTPYPVLYCRLARVVTMTLSYIWQVCSHPHTLSYTAGGLGGHLDSALYDMCAPTPYPVLYCRLGWSP